MSSAFPATLPERPRLAGLAAAILAAALLALALASGAAAADKKGGKNGELTLLLQLRHPQGLASLVRSVSDPKSPDYGNYGSVESIVKRFGASPKDKHSTLQWLREHGATARLGATGTYVTARVPAPVAAYALPLRSAAGGAFGQNADARRVPASLRGVVTHVSTLGTREGVFDENVEKLAAPPSGTETGLKGTSVLPNTGTPTGCAEGREAGAAPAPLKGFTPNEYLDAYGHSSLHEQGFKGQGKDIAVIEIDGFRRSDIDTFAKCFGLPSPNLQVRPVGIPKPLPPGDETTLDLEVLTATAPKLQHLYVYEGGSSEAGILLSVAAALGSKGHHPDAISISLGGCEADLTTQIAFRDVLDEVFAVAGASGISVLVAAGDQGSSACEREIGEVKTALPLLSVSDPASSEFVTGVGGTNFELTKQNKIKRELVWNDTPLAIGGGGGGASILSTPRPWWQKGLLNSYGNGRLVPDVSGLADIAPGYAIYCTAAECKDPEALPDGGWMTVGGTSAATPLYAGGILLVDGYNEAHGVPPVGFLNPLVYEVGREARSGGGEGVLHDVTRGNNDLGILLPKEAGGGRPLGCCSANAGYDAASGWGSLDVASLAKTATGKLNAAKIERAAVKAAERRAVEAAEGAVEAAKRRLEAHPER